VLRERTQLNIETSVELLKETGLLREEFKSENLLFIEQLATHQDLLKQGPFQST
jgi:hypothetical protein